MNKLYKNILHSYMFIAIMALLTVCVISIASIMTVSVVFGLIGLTICVVLALYLFFIRRVNMARIDTFIASVDKSITGSSVVDTTPLPTVVLYIDGNIMWFNKQFGEIFGETVLDTPITGIITDLKWGDILKSTNGINADIVYDNRFYNITGNIVLDNDTNEMTVVLYFIDYTDNKNLQTQYANERIDIAIINIDNYDEFLQRFDDTKRQECINKIDKIIGEWSAESCALRRRTDRDRYLILFEHQYLREYVNKKFDVIDKVREIGETVNQSITISIGVGVGGTVTQNDEYARLAIEMALGRGGDQAVIKDTSQYTFFGGKSKEYERSTRVKTRSFSNALREYILQSDKVMIMGHKTPDYDSLGAMIGLQRAVRALGKNPYALIDNTVGVRKLLDEANTFSEYTDLFIDAATAMEAATKDTLLIIVDTHRPTLMCCAELLNKVNKKVLIDHHRSSTDFVQGCSLTYHEPYASSTCEMVTEVLQYIDDGCKINPFEAKALYVGLLMDTKNFVMKTGVRTFEAASYLRRYGVDTIMVKSLFKVDKDDYIHRVDIVKQTQISDSGIAISVCTEAFPNVRVISSQAADEILSLGGVKASFVIFPDGNDFGISGRSLGDMNVQLILEKLGGGGHMMVAGVKISGIESIEQAREMLVAAIDDYIRETNSD